MTNLERKNLGLIYNPMDEEIMNLQRDCLKKWMSLTLQLLRSLNCGKKF